MADHAARRRHRPLSSTDAKFDRKELTLTVAPRKRLSPRQLAVQAGRLQLPRRPSPPSTGSPPSPASRSPTHILSHTRSGSVSAWSPRLNGDDAVIDIASITGVWPSANFYEREVFDLFGVHFSRPPQASPAS